MIGGSYFSGFFLEYLLWCISVAKIRLKLTQMIHYAMSKNQKPLVKNYSWEKLGIGDELALADQSERSFRPSAFLID